MGQVIRQISPNTTRYYWYPGEKREWLRALFAVGAGGAAFGLALLFTRQLLPATVLGLSTAVGVIGFNLGRRDAAALDKLGGEAATRRELAGAGGRAAWRGLVAGVAAAVAALIIANLSSRGFLADWVLPLAPAVAGGLAREGGLLSVRLGRQSAPASTLRPPGVQIDPTARLARPAGTGGEPRAANREQSTAVLKPHLDGA